MQTIDRLYRIPFLLAALLAIGASIYFLLSPTTIQEVVATTSANGSQTIEELSRQASWYEVQGVWGVVVLLIFALLYSSTAYLALRNRLVALAIASASALMLTILAGFSIGPLYIPALLTVVVGWLTLGLGKMVRRKKQASG
ncbi:MAG: hypothetical protein J4N82_11370 [Chloroflexi bacterium]|nr:hypothetical protein [Chloroflexota bacterium]MCI0862524.1 hypothetical protein [Chloroflexota bacterium]